VARERLARVQLAQDRPDEVLKTLAGGSPGAFKPRFDELRGDALLRKGDTEGAIGAYREALKGAEPGVVDAGQVQLKLNDLGAGEAAPEEIESAPEEASQ
jgi:predicted negative regulator of RcsB-dependent stress response